MAKWRAEDELRRCSLWALRAPALGAEAALLTLAVEAGEGREAETEARGASCLNRQKASKAKDQEREAFENC